MSIGDPFPKSFSRTKTKKKKKKKKKKERFVEDEIG